LTAAGPAASVAGIAEERTPVARSAKSLKSSKRSSTKAPVGTLERGLSILGYFKTSPEASIPDVADAIGLSRSTTYRIAERLRELGFLEVNAGTNRWRLGGEAVQLGVVALQSTDVMQVAPEPLRVLLQMAGEAVNLAVFDSDSMVLLYREQGPQSVTISSRLGSHRPMHASSLGKAFLYAMSESERRVLLGRLQLKRYTPATITSLAALERDLGESRQRGYTIDRSEFEATLACCAAPVFDHRGLPVAAISVSGPAERVSPQFERIGGLVASTARAISARLGHVAAGDRNLTGLGGQPSLIR
jgi:DNA-binding IclR family transcriptional regulator